MPAPEAGVSSMSLGTEVCLELSEQWEGRWKGNWGEIMSLLCLTRDFCV